MKNISIVQTGDRNINQLQQNIAQALKLVLANPIISGTILSSVNLSIGTNTINHGLDRTLQGWFLVLVSGGVNLYDNQSTNPNANKTLILVSDAAVTVSLYVF